MTWNLIILITNDTNLKSDWYSSKVLNMYWLTNFSLAEFVVLKRYTYIVLIIIIIPFTAANIYCLGIRLTDLKLTGILRHYLNPPRNGLKRLIEIVYAYMDFESSNSSWIWKPRFAKSTYKIEPIFWIHNEQMIKSKFFFLYAAMI